MGQVKRIGTGSGRFSYYVLTLTPNPSGSTRTLPGFEFPAEARKQLAPLARYQQVTVEGRCEGRSVPEGARQEEIILFRECRIVSVGPVPPAGPRGRGNNPAFGR
jgi:hypothetical protein